MLSNFRKTLDGFKTVILVSALFAVAFTTSACTKKVDDTDTTINSYLRETLKGLDPIHANDLYSGIAIGQIYESLFQYHYLKRPYVLIPALAESMPTTSADGLTHTIKLKKGVHFQDNPCFTDGKGREMTADDVIYSFKRLADPSNLGDGWWIFDGKIKGFNEWVETRKKSKTDATFNAPIEGLQAPDKNTLVIQLTQPYYQLYYVMAHQFASVIPHEAVEKYGAEFLNNPVGTGPYMLAKSSDWIRGSKLTLTKNPAWRGETYPTEGEPGDKEAGLLEDAGKPLPFADKLVLNEMPEDQPRWQNYMKGNFEFIDVPNDNFDSAIKDKKPAPELAAKGMSISITPDLDTTFYAFNMKDPIIGKNKLVRQAMSLAQDPVMLIDRFYNGRAIPAYGPVPPEIDGYDPSFKSEWRQFNVKKAKELLAKAGYPEGKGLPEFDYETQADSKIRQMAESFAQEMAAIGVKVKINTNTWPQFNEKTKKGEFQIMDMAWSADYPDAQDFLQLFYSKNVSPGPNDSGFANVDFDKLYEKALALPPGAERNALYGKMQTLLAEECPWIFEVHRTTYDLRQGWLHNFKWSYLITTNYKYIRIDPKQRAELKPKL
jgi:oligopeptide transport system substrate-binding protein